MRNPLRRLGTSVRRLLGRPSAASAADGPRSQAPAEGAARPADVPALAVDIVRREFAALAGKLQKEVGRRHERLQIALAEFREFAALVETTVKTQLKGMAGEITQLRRDVKAHLERAERRAEPLETSLASIHQRTAELQLGIEKLAEAFDHQLSRTESGLQALRQASAHQAAEAREAQRLQSEILERAGRDALRVARASAERFSRRILDMAGAFEREALTSGPLDELDDGAARPEDDRSFRWLPSAMARWWPARLRGSERLLRISRRLDDLESRLERRDAERARWSRALRETCEEELRLLAELSGEERDARREPDAEDTLLFAREIRSRRGAIPGEGGWRAREDRILEKAPHP